MHDTPHESRVDVGIGEKRTGIETMDWWLCLGAALYMPLCFSMLRYSAGGVTLRASDAVALLVILGSLFYGKSYFRTYFSAMMGFMACLGLYVLFLGFYEKNVIRSLKEAIQLAFVVATAVSVGFHQHRNPRRFLEIFLLGILLSLLVTLGYHFSIGQFYRYKASFEGRYLFGICTMLMVIMVYNKGIKSYWTVLLVISLVPLVASMERKGLIGAVGVFLVLFVHSLFMRLKVNLTALLAMLFLAALPLIVYMIPTIVDGLNAAFLDNYFIDEDLAVFTSNIHRKALLINGYEIFMEKPWLGYGADMVSTQMLRYFGRPDLANSTHNFYLDNLIKYGVVGAGMYFVAIFYGAWGAWLESGKSLCHFLYSVYFFFVIAFISDGSAVTYLALLPAMSGSLFKDVTSTFRYGRKRDNNKSGPPRTPLGSSAMSTGLRVP